MNLIGPEMFEFYCFNTTLPHVDNLLNVWKIIKNKVFEQLANKRYQNMCNDQFYKTATPHSRNFEFDAQSLKKNFLNNIYKTQNANK